MVVPRRTAPRELNVYDVEGVLERWFTMKNTRDLDAGPHSLKQHVTWKNAARASILAEYADLFGLFTNLSPAGFLPAKKLAMAITACHQRRPVNFSAKDTATFADDASGFALVFRSIGRSRLTRRRDDVVSRRPQR